MGKEPVAGASVTINAPVEAVWNALVNPEAIREYLFGAKVLTDWRPGSAIVWKGEWDGNPYEEKGVVLACEPRRMLRYTHFKINAGLPDSPENYRTATIELADGGVYTTVSLSQENNGDARARGHSERNWTTMLAALKRHVERRP